MLDNTLYYGDNLDVMQRYVKDESVDLVYLDPPFNSNQSYNVLFAEKGGTGAAAQIKAFEDTWHWDQGAEGAYHTVVESGGTVSLALQAFRRLLGENDMMAYLAMMAPRLMELRRVLTLTGSIYLHCDPTASHYLKMLMDAIFGPVNYRNEIVWKRYGAHNDSHGYGRVHDTILFYQRSKDTIFNKQHQEYEPTYVDERFRFRDPDGRRWSEQNLASPNPRPNLTYPFTAANGVTYEPPAKGWKYTKERLGALDREGRLHYPRKRDSRLRLKNYMDELPGVPVQDLWTDLGSLGGTNPERLGYPTQKPEALLERIIRASSNEGATVLDPFCGCGTAIVAAQRLGRQWIGIDVTHLAVTLMKRRLADTFGDAAKFKVVGEPTTADDAAALAEQDPYQFQWWALGLVGARPAEGKKGADKGIDGRLFFHDEGPGGKTKQIVFSVKAGHTSVPHVRDLRGVLDREQAEFGVLISMQQPTQPMRVEAASAGFYTSPGWRRTYPRLQLLTITDLLAGKRLDMPPVGQVNATFRRAARAPGEQAETMALPLLER